MNATVIVTSAANILEAFTNKTIQPELEKRNANFSAKTSTATFNNLNI